MVLAIPSEKIQKDAEQHRLDCFLGIQIFWCLPSPSQDPDHLSRQVADTNSSAVPWKICGIEYNNEFEKENDDTFEENYMTVYVKMSYGKTISTKYNRNWTAAVIPDEVERRSSIPRDMIRLVHNGKMLSEKETMKEHNIEAETTIEMSLRLLGGMEMNEQMDIHETEEDREKKRKLDEGREGNAMKSNDDLICMRRDIMEALKRSDEKMESNSIKTNEKQESYSKNTDERMNNFSRKAEEMLEKFMMVSDAVGSQIQGMKTSIVSMQEMNEKTKEEGEKVQSIL